MFTSEWKYAGRVATTADALYLIKGFLRNQFQYRLRLFSRVHVRVENCKSCNASRTEALQEFVVAANQTPHFVRRALNDRLRGGEVTRYQQARLLASQKSTQQNWHFVYRSQSESCL